MLWVCTGIDHRKRQHVIRTSVIHSVAPRKLLCYCYPISSSVICYWTNEQHHGIYLIIWRTELCFGKGNMTWYQNNTRHFSIKMLRLAFTVCFLFYDRLLCYNGAILVSCQFLGLLLLKSGKPAMGNSLKSVLFSTVGGQTAGHALWKWGEVFLLRIWLYFFLLKSGRNYS